MLKNNLQAMEQNLRSIAKRYKSVKYSIGLVILFLMMGVGAFSQDVMTTEEIAASRETLKNSVESLQTKVSNARRENQKEINGLKLELIQLIEQGSQVVKSPWASWQFGINYVYNNMSGTYKGRGDKPSKYIYNSIYRRGNWEERNALDVLAGKSVEGMPITPGNENTSTWQTSTATTTGKNLKRDLSIDASTNGGREWGLVELRKIREPINEIEILARVVPKEVKKDKLDIPVSITPPTTLSAPVVNPNVNKPKDAPEVKLPPEPNLVVPNAPTINNDPVIKVLTVNKVGAITIDTPEVKPVDFIIKAGGLSGTPARNFHQDTANKTYNLTGPITVTGNDFISTWGKISGLNTINNDITVTGTKTRAFMIDEGIDYRYGEGTPTNTIKPFIYGGENRGTIRLQNSKTVGLDVQGTHTSYSEGAGQSVNPGFDTVDKVANIKVTNKGTIIGEGGANIENQVAFGFNNFDTSSNNTRTQMINEGTVTLGAENSVAIQLRPEDPYAQTNTSDKKGLNMMTGENIDKGTITLNGAGSFGILTVKNKNLKKYEDSKEKSTDLANSKNYDNYGVTTSAGGQIASRAQEDYKSLVKNTGEINIDSDNSIGVGILNSIQSVEVGGTINIGKGTLGTFGDKAGGVSGKVDGAVGVYTEEKTRPVAASTFAYKDNGDQEYEADGSLKVKTASKDDHGIVNVSTATETYSTKDADGNPMTKTRLTGKQIGTDTVEVSGIINLGDKSTKSFGLRNSKTGSITLVGTGTVNVEGKENFGALSNATNGVININSAAKIIATGTQSIGYAMLDGAGINAGTIDVTGNNTPTPGATTYEGSLGFYGEKGTFTNTGTIKTEGKLAHAVVVKNPGMKFEHYGTIDVNSPAGTPGNIGVFSDGKATVNFKDNSNVFVRKNSIGIYSEDKAKFNDTFKNHGTLNIKIEENSTFAYLNGDATTTLKEFFVKNKDDKDVTVNITDEMGTNSSLVYADNGAKAVLDGNYTITKGNTSTSTIALLAANDSTVNVASGKTLTTNTQVALAAVSGSKAQNDGNVVSNKSDKGIGIYAKDTGSEGINVGTITMEKTNAIGMYGKDVAKLESSDDSNIKVKKTGSVGMYGVVSKLATVLPFTVKNAGTIELEEGGSAGIYLVNESKATDIIGNLSASNTGTIKLKSGEGSIGIYAPKATISNVGTIEIANTATKSIAAYISNGGKITDASTATINLGTSGSNIAYYIKDAKTSIEGTDVGTVSGRGVGVYLEGTTGSVAELKSTAPLLNFTKGGNDNGNGIVGLYLKGKTKISDYINTITVGNTVVDANNPDNVIASSIGIYSDAQGADGTGNEYTIKADIVTGKKAVGIYSAKGANKSYIKYEGAQMDLGEGSTGFYVNGKTELASPIINSAGGLIAYVTENSTFKGGAATVNLSASGIGVYGERGAIVEVGTWNFNNNGNAAEEIRLKEGQAGITTDKSLKTKMVLTHVINGETYLDTGKTVTVADARYTQEENIGLMAQGVKSPAAAAPPNVLAAGGWKEADYEVTNKGTIDFTTSKKSTAIYAESARVKNAGTIKLGESSTGIYGVYKADTPSLPGVTNTVKVDTTANSNISLGKGSTGMYLVNAEHLNTAGGTIESVTGATNNVGIYAINGEVTGDATYNANSNNFKKLVMDNKSNINLGNGSVGIYTRGKGTASADRNTVTNEGNIRVGDALTGAPAVGIYVENTNLTQGNTVVAPDITVGENAIAFYGKNSTVIAKGTVNYTNKGVLGYFEDSEFTSHYGDLTANQNTILYLKNSKANMNGAGADIDITVPDKAATSASFAGVYVEGTSELNGVNKITVGENSNGIYMNKAVNFISSAKDIESTKDGAKALLGEDSSFTNRSKITLSGKESVGIYAKNTTNTVKNITNEGELNLSGEKTLGAYLIGKQNFENKANINIADSADSKKPTIGIYTAKTDVKDSSGNVVTYEGSDVIHTTGTIEVGEKSVGIFSKTTSKVELNGGKIHVKDQAIGIYKEKGKAILNGEIDIDAHTGTVVNTEPTGVYGLNGADITDNASKITVGAKSFGFILENETPATTNKYTSTGAGTVSLGEDSVFLYSNGQASLTNGRDISSNSKRLIGFYIKGNGTNRGDLTNNATIDFSNSLGSIGIYAPGGKATNKGRILVGKTDSIDPATGKTYVDTSKITYGIGMAADNGGHIINDSEIRIYGDKSIGMYGKGVGTKVENTKNGSIILDGSRATDTDKIQSMVGVYVDEGAKFINYGDIRTADAYAGKNVGGAIKVNNNVVGLAGVVAMNGSTLENWGNIDIDANESFGVVVRNSVIKNFGNFRIKVRGKGTYGVSYKDISAADLAALQAIVNSKLTSDPTGQELALAGGANKSYEGVSITIQNGKPIFTRNGVLVSDAEVEKIEKIIGEATSNLGMSDVGFYVDTLGRTKPIDIDGATPPINSQLIVGTEYSELTNKKEWFVKDDVIAPFLQQIQGRNFKLTSIAGSLTWMATPVLDSYGQIKGVAMTKLPYTAFVEKSHNAWNFADGLEQRYGMNALDSREKRVFNLLNSIGNNEEILLTQAYDEMMGHQYANVQQRIYETGNILNREFSYLRNAWSNPTKDANKVKVFGTNGEYKTDTAGIIDYKYNAQGVAYVHEDESVKLGETVGWYAGLVHNRYKFEDIGRSKEEMLQGKVGMFKSVPFDDNNSLNWTISGDVFVGYNKMHRRFLVVNEIFNAKSRYYSYGLGVKNELSKEFRLSEGFALKPYGALRLEYGRMSKIKEKSGEVKLEVKSNDYISIKPEIGAELSYRAFFGPKSLKAAVTVAYENELGVLANPKNKARVAGTSADWFNIRGEKEDRRGNVKTDLNIGVDNQRIGLTGNIGYDTKGSNIRGGLGLRVIF